MLKDLIYNLAGVLSVSSSERLIEGTDVFIDDPNKQQGELNEIVTAAQIDLTSNYKVSDISTS